MATNTIEKLRILNSEDILILNKPDDIHEFDNFLFDTKEKKQKYNIIITFIFSIDEFIDNLKNVISKDLLHPEGYLYFIYPKKGNKKYGKYIGRDDFFGPAEIDDNGYALKSKLKFNKMLAFDETFTLIGLKHVEKKKKMPSSPSQLVSDYINKIPELKNLLLETPEILTIFNQLTPGYQRGWTRYVFSTKSQETTNKRLNEMKKILKQGYKSIDLYRQGKKR
jgi:hypothetical protein